MAVHSRCHSGVALPLNYLGCLALWKAERILSVLLMRNCNGHGLCVFSKPPFSGNRISILQAVRAENRKSSLKLFSLIPHPIHQQILSALPKSRSNPSALVSSPHPNPSSHLPDLMMCLRTDRGFARYTDSIRYLRMVPRHSGRPWKFRIQLRRKKQLKEVRCNLSRECKIPTTQIREKNYRKI